MNNNTAFVAISFHKKFGNVYDLAIEPAIRKNGLTPSIANGEDLVLRDIYDDIALKLEKSKIVIVDLSRIRDNEGNYINLNNVYYETGLANGINKRCIILAQDIENDVPFDLRRFGCLSYDPDNLTALRDELTDKIAQAKDEDPVKIFNDIEILSPEMKKDFIYFKNKSKKITVNICPPTADIFFNDKLLGQSPQEIYVNTEVTIRNTISAANSSYFEMHREITEDEIKKGEIFEKLDLSSDETISERVPNWLRYRNKDTKNPVLMRAISQYLRTLNTKEDFNDAKLEAAELLEIAPQWYLSYNQMGNIVERENDSAKEALRYYGIVSTLSPSSYIGYYNQACVLAKNKDFSDSLKLVKKIELESVLKSYAFSRMRLSIDNDFDAMKDDKEFGEIFKKLVENIDKKANDIKSKLNYDC